MSYSIRNVVDAESMLKYCSANLGWGIDLSAFEDIDEVTYDFSAKDLGLQDEAFAKIKDLRQLRPLADQQPFGVFLITFENKSLSVTALRRILQRLTPSRYGREYKTWKSDRIIFFCFWGTNDRRSIGFAAFENRVEGCCPALKIVYCTPSIEDEVNRNEFERKLALLQWPRNANNQDEWFSQWHKAFSVTYRSVITDSRNLVQVLASIASRLKDDFISTLQSERAEGQFHALWDCLKRLLGNNYTAEDFADMFAQSIVYGFFTARCMANETMKFGLDTALASMPKTNPFLYSVLGLLCHSKDISIVDVSLLNELTDALAATNIKCIVDDFNRQTSMGNQVEDPVVYFYERFLDCYEKEQRKRMGDYFTPLPAAGFMVRAVEYILVKRFGAASGFLDQRVSVLDPGTGTATCLRNIVLRAHEEFLKSNKQVDWAGFVETSLLPRINGFEMMVAPYAIAHLKLALALKETGYVSNGTCRIGVYLKNALKPFSDVDTGLSSELAKVIETEISQAARITNGAIEVVIGGPPFRENSANKEPWILDLMQTYKKEPGTNNRIEEQNLRPLSNDYVKFIRFAQDRIKDNAHAVVAYVIPHTYVDNLTFRGMRWSLLTDFSAIYILDLHGNVLGQGRAEDQNIFDIQQGVCVTVFVKSPKPDGSLAKVYYSEVTGSRSEKFNFLRSRSLDDIEWRELNPVPPSYFMSPRGMKSKSSHLEWIDLAALFPLKQVGVKTHHDNELISMTRFDSPHDQLYAYRPFDTRHINYDRTKVERDRFEVVQHFIGHRNLGVVIDRQVMADNWSHFQVVEHMIDNRLHYSRKGNPYLCPIYLFDAAGRKSLNIDRAIVGKFADATGLKFSESETTDSECFDVLDIVDYAYAILYGNVFRHKYAAVLSLNYPSIPLPHSRQAFRAFAEQGKVLRELHSYGKIVPNDLAIKFVDRGGTVVSSPHWTDGKAYINRHSYLVSVPEVVWDYCFAGYRGLQKWLKDRNGMALSETDIQHMVNAFNIIAKSIDVSKYIDSLSLAYFNGFERDEVTLNLSVLNPSGEVVDYTISPQQTEWRDAAHRPTSGFTAD